MSRTCLMALIGIISFAGDADAFGGRKSSSSCGSSCGTYDHCHAHYDCCHHHHCHCYHLIATLQAGGPYPTIVYGAQVGHRIAVRVNFPTGTATTPTGEIAFAQSGAGKFSYDGSYLTPAQPGMPGAPLSYTMLLTPTNSGPCHVDFTFTTSGATRSITVPFTFNITP